MRGEAVGYVLVPNSHEDPMTFPAHTLPEAAEAADDVPGAALALAGQWSERLPLPGSGATVELWEALATLAAADLSVARAVEPHLDAVAILAEAGLPGPRAPGACTPPRGPASGSRPDGAGRSGCSPAPSPGARWPGTSITPC